MGAGDYLVDIARVFGAMGAMVVALKHGVGEVDSDVEVAWSPGGHGAGEGVERSSYHVEGYLG